ncbi:hypothetical protein CKM354_000006800 [Cercospora kikuchii]|uniref:Uncharacterized protein n=1 Tax=Cercospora kikuchii TaxID=84275 RepID=A0A9P3CD65_9PEZI|nr:uncharacterized protein CKM354_000006800 [Cercospora kikuchii]GIZ36598.1 hypothetical protein CKM354_000006800 [Cercospora kikuchii]
MWSVTLIVLCFIAYVAASHESDVELLKRSYGQQCRNSKCSKAIASDRNGKKACSSYLLATVTLCSSTYTAAAQCTVIAGPTTKTTTITVTVSKVTTVTNTVTSEETPSPVTVTQSAVVTVTQEALEKRHVRPSKCPTTSRTSKTPERFCKSCPNASDFAAACSCLGVRPSTTTLKPKTITVTTGSCATITPKTVVTDLTTLTETSTTQVTETITNTLATETKTVTETSTSTVLPPEPTTQTCFKPVVPSENGAIAFGDGDALIFDSADLIYGFETANPSVPGIIRNRNYETVYIYAVAPRADTGGGNLDGLRLTPDRALAANFKCSFVNGRLACTSTRDGIKTQLLRCNFRAADPSDNTEVFIGEPGTNGNCRAIEVEAVIQPADYCDPY